jgi:hypothetical protein
MKKNDAAKPKKNFVMVYIPFRNKFREESPVSPINIYLAAYIKVQNDASPSEAAGEAALASIFIHSFGYTGP